MTRPSLPVRRLRLPIGAGGGTSRARVALVVLGFAAVLSIGLFQVGRRRAIVQIGYDLGQTSGALRRLEEEERRLKLELSVLTAPERIERLSGELGMVRPPPGATRVASPHPRQAGGGADRPASHPGQVGGAGGEHPARPARAASPAADVLAAVATGPVRTP